MPLKSVSIDEKKKEVTIVMSLDKRIPSKSGKTLRVCSTEGNKPSDAKVDGKTVIVGVNAYIKKDAADDDE
jgi:hypothetical protein